jgi:hypothetical protein
VNPRTTGALLLVALALGAFVWFYQVRGSEQRKEAEAEAKRLFPDLTAEDLRAIELETSDGADVRLEFGDRGWRIVRPIDFPADEAALSGITSNLADLASEALVAEPQAPEVYGLGPDAAEVRFSAKGVDHTVRFGKKTPVDYNTYATADGGAAVYVVASYRANAFQRSLDDLRERRVLRFDRDAVDHVEVAWPGGGATLEKREGAWRVIAPLDAPADSRTLDDLLADLSFLRADGFLEPPDPKVEAGFAAPAFRALLRAPGEAGGAPREWTFAVGPAVQGGLAAHGSEPTLYRIAAERLEDFPRRLAAYRQRTLAEFASSDARGLELVFQPSGEAPVAIRAERTDAGWTSQPEAIAPGRAARLVTELSRLRAEDIAADEMGEAELAKLGLAPPRAILRAFAEPPPEEGGATPLGEVWLGELDAKRGIFARRPDAPTVFLLDAVLAEHVPLSLEAFRNRFVAKEGEAGAASPDAEGEPSLEDLLPPGDAPPEE